MRETPSRGRGPDIGVKSQPLPPRRLRRPLLCCRLTELSQPRPQWTDCPRPSEGVTTPSGLRSVGSSHDSGCLAPCRDRASLGPEALGCPFESAHCPGRGLRLALVGLFTRVLGKACGDRAHLFAAVSSALGRCLPHSRGAPHSGNTRHSRRREGRRVPGSVFPPTARARPAGDAQQVSPIDAPLHTECFPRLSRHSRAKIHLSEGHPHASFLEKCEGEVASLFLSASNGYKWPGERTQL